MPLIHGFTVLHINQIKSILLVRNQVIPGPSHTILDILGISVFGYSIYMCTHEKQDLFSNDLDNAGFKYESVMGFQSIYSQFSLSQISSEQQNYFELSVV